MIAPTEIQSPFKMVVSVGAAIVLGALLLLAPTSGPAHAADSCQPSGSQVVCTFEYTGAAQSWTVPDGVTQATFDVYGAQGGSEPTGKPGGLGGEATATIAVTPGDTLQVNVGGKGGDGTTQSGGGGFNGGYPGGGGTVDTHGGGGGASDVRSGGIGLANRIIVAGGGGGAGGFGGAGGGGGGLSGTAGGDYSTILGTSRGGGGGTSSAGGSGGAGSDDNRSGDNGSAGNSGSGGSGGFGAPFDSGSGGGGGGGYYGGGGGSGIDGAGGGGGGGGSGFGPSGVVFDSGVRAGNGLVTISYTAPVGYDFQGFFSPVDNPDVATNKAKAGSAIPVKFSLAADQGLDIFATGTNPTTNETFTYPTSTAMACDSTDELDAVEETVSAGGSSLQYDAALEQYTYVWKTNKAWAGTCRQLVVKLDDGSYHRANFRFVK
jgi:hypothetical protein